MDTLEQIERYAICCRLRLMDYNITHTAESLQIGIRTLQRKLIKYGLPRQSAVGIPTAIRRETIKQFVLGELMV